MVEVGIGGQVAADINFASSRNALAYCLDEESTTYLGEKGCVKSKGAVRLTSTSLTNDREDGLRAGVA